MKNTVLVFFLFLFLVCNCDGNKRVNRVTERYSNGNVKVICKLNGPNNEDIFERMTFSQSGKKIKIENFVANSVNIIGWSRNGKKKAESLFVNGKKHGLWREWYSNGSIKREYLYNSGLLVQQTEYKKFRCIKRKYTDAELALIQEYTNGIVSLEKVYKDGGVVKKRWFYPDGKISDEREYMDGLLNGRCVCWERNGQEKSETFYLKGKLVKASSSLE